MGNEPFKVCPMCGVAWKTLDDFLTDPALKQSGYQVNFFDLKGGLFYFTHTVENCGTTMAIPVGEFTSLSDRSILALRGEPGGEQCTEKCLREDDLSPCPAQCECVWVREVMQTIKERKKRISDGITGSIG